MRHVQTSRNCRELGSMGYDNHPIGSCNTQDMGGTMQQSEAFTRRIATLIAGVLLTGCSSDYKEPLLDYSQATLQEKFSIEQKATAYKPPYLGLALAGGGTKASNFSMGVLKGLVESGQMENVDVISSVSGGGYATYWYYSRLVFDDPDFASNRATAPAFIKSIFLDCLPSRFMDESGVTFQSSTWLPRQPHPCPQYNHTNLLKVASDDEHDTPQQRMTVKKQFDQLMDALDRPELGSDPYRFQNYLRGYQDIFSTGLNMFGAHAFDYTTTSEDGRFSNEVVELIPMEVGSVVANAFGNILFDWNLELSATQYAYAKGIVRTYGASPPNCDKQTEGCITTIYGNDIRIEGDMDQARSLTFDDIKRVHEIKGAPLWIINTTAGEDRSVLDIGKRKPFYLSAFEIDPYQHGSGLYGYHQGAPDSLPPFKAVLSSAAFSDSQQKVVPNILGRNALNALLRISAADWGYSIRNPNAGDFQYGLHYLLPFPLYYAERLAGEENSAFIHLSDGGMSENLGAYALIRRGTANLIVSDHAGDRDGEMIDLCWLKNGLEKTLKNQNLRLLLPGLSNLDRHCQLYEDGNTGYNIFAWRHPVLVGCIVSKSLESLGCENLPTSLEKGQYAAHLFLIKPALANTAMREKLNKIGNVCFYQSFKNKIDRDRACTKEIRDACQFPNTSDDSPMWQGAPPPSCEMFAFFLRNATGSDGMHNDGCPNFPQYATVALTMDSSPWIFGGMRELGAYYAGRINWFFNPDGSLNEERFLAELRYQRHLPIPWQSQAAMGRYKKASSCLFINNTQAMAL
jgi:hypothetical protein